MLRRTIVEHVIHSLCIPYIYQPFDAICVSYNVADVMSRTMQTGLG